VGAAHRPCVGVAARPTVTVLVCCVRRAQVASSASAHMADVRRKNDPLIRAKRTGVTTMTAELGLDLEDEHAAAAAAAAAGGGDGDGDGDGAHDSGAAEKAQRPTIANDPLGLFSKPKGQVRCARQPRCGVGRVVDACAVVVVPRAATQAAVQGTACKPTEEQQAGQLQERQRWQPVARAIQQG